MPTDKIKSLQSGLNILKREDTEKKLEMFPLVSQNEMGINEIHPLIVEHFSDLEEKLSSFFPSQKTEKYDWIKNLFVETSNDFELTLMEEKELS